MEEGPGKGNPQREKSFLTQSRKGAKSSGTDLPYTGATMANSGFPQHSHRA
jgi:hypothetical protein